MNDYIRLHPSDNVVVALKNLPAASVIQVDGLPIQLPSGIDFGHKIAIRSIEAEEKILKHGLPIGSATKEIVAGEHVHVQNVRTDYSIK